MTHVNAGTESAPSRRAARRAAIPGAIALLLLAACATTPPPGTPVPVTELGAPPPAGAPFEPLGELLYSGGRSAAYGMFQVMGPRVNLTYTADGKWAGNLDGRDVWLTAAPGKLTGAGVNLHILAEGDRVTIQGTWFQRKISLTVSPDAVAGRAGGPSYDLKRVSPSLWSGATAAGRAELAAGGNAQQFPKVPMPQFVLALLAALP